MTLENVDAYIKPKEVVYIHKSDVKSGPYDETASLCQDIIYLTMGYSDVCTFGFVTMWIKHADSN